MASSKSAPSTAPKKKSCDEARTRCFILKPKKKGSPARLARQNKRE